jgi:hypothetical protein
VFGLGVFSVIQSVLLVLIVAWRLDIPGGRATLLHWFGVLMLTSMASLGLGLFVASMAGNTLRAMLLHSVAINPQLFLSGALVPISQLDAGSRTMADSTIGRWAVSLLGYYAGIKEVIEAQVGANDYLEQFDLDPNRAIGAFVSMFVIFIVLAMVILKWRDARRR